MSTNGLFLLDPAVLDRWIQSDRIAVFLGKHVVLTIPLEDTYAAAPRHTVGVRA